VIAGYPHFLGLASRLQWDAETIDLDADAAAWPGLDPDLRARLLALIAGFCVGERAVATDLAPFAAAAADPAMAACFRAQERDEQRHARFFDRLAAEVVGIDGETPAERQAGLRGLLAPEYLQLFERRLPAVARDLAAGEGTLPEAVGLYHMVLEGVVFAVGQFAIRALVDHASDLPGLREGVGLVLRDERWHVGFGTRCLKDADVTPSLGARILRDGQEAAEAWTGVVADRLAGRVREMHRRRLSAIGLVPPRGGTTT
jgi:ribonucleoside-diphosphate reductase beta chain